MNKQVKQIEEQPSEGLERAVNASWADYEYSASDNLYSSCYKDGFRAGARWQKEEMLSGAIEFVAQENVKGGPSPKQGELCFVAFHLCLPPKYGDKVKIIIVKEDEK